MKENTYKLGIAFLLGGLFVATSSRALGHSVVVVVLTSLAVLFYALYLNAKQRRKELDRTTRRLSEQGALAREAQQATREAVKSYAAQ